MSTARLTYAQLEAAWIRAGGSPALAPLMAAIAEAESGGAYQPSGPFIPGAGGFNADASTGDFSVGPWQINYYGNLGPARTAEYGPWQQLLSDPTADARAAVSLAAGGSGLANWTTYTSGAYRSYLSGANGGQGGANYLTSTNPDGTVSNVGITTDISLGGALGVLNPIHDVETIFSALGGAASGVEKSYKALTAFVAAMLAPSTWIRFGEVILGGVFITGGIAALAVVLAGSSGGQSTIGTLASLIPGEGQAARLGGKVAGTVGGRASTTYSRRASARARTTSARARATSATARQQRAETSLARARAREAERTAPPDEDDLRAARAARTGRQNRSSYRRMARGRDTSDLRRRTA